MRCPECGTQGYSRKTKTPEFRCRNPKCGFEWDDAILELRLEEQRRRDDAILESRLEEQRRRNDQAELEELRRNEDDRRRRLPFEEEQRRRKDQGDAWGAGCAFIGRFIGLVIGRALSDSAQGSILGGVLLGVIGYVVGKNWRDWTS